MPSWPSFLWSSRRVVPGQEDGRLRDERCEVGRSRQCSTRRLLDGPVTGVSTGPRLSSILRDISPQSLRWLGARPADRRVSAYSAYQAAGLRMVPRSSVNVSGS